MPNPTPSERNTMVHISKQIPLELGTAWFAVSRKWYQAWETATAGVPNKTYADITEAKLGPVDNTDLVCTGTTEMLPGLVEGYQFELVPEDSWSNLVEWYGKPPITLKRQVVAYPTASGLPETRVEVYYPNFYIFLLVSRSATPIPHAEIRLSSNSSLSKMAKLIASTLGVPKSSTYRLWNMPPITPKTGVSLSQVERGTLLLVPSDDSTPLTDFGRMGRVFAIEVCAEDGRWLLDAESVSAPGDPSVGVDFGDPKDEDRIRDGPFPGRDVGLPASRGTMGLQNLGHTCFMNAGLQCLIHIPEIERYFLENLHLHELNPSNPLGTDGQLAKAFTNVVHHMYPNKAIVHQDRSTFSQRRVGSSSSYAARHFHDLLCQYAPVFAGYEENDSQELIGIVLDSLHEDLNRVLKKPYVERPEWPEEDLEIDFATTEERVAKETWEGHLRRNDSVINDLFCGMYKSTLKCLSCGKISVTFEPFVSLALPLPAAGAPWEHSVYYVPWDTRQAPLVLRLRLPKNSSSSQLKDKLIGTLGVEGENLLVAEVWKHKFFKFFDDDANITELSKEDTLVVYELPVPATPSGSNSNFTMILPVLHISSGSPFGLPILIVVNHTEASSVEQLGRAISERLLRWTNAENLHSSPFKLYAFGSGGNKLESGFRFSAASNLLQDLSAREASYKGAPLVKPTEALVCEWPSDVKGALFPGGESDFNKWESHSKLAEAPPISIKQEPITLDDCLDELTKTEHLGTNDAWYCSRCKRHRQATKQLQLWSTPTILVFQIKRFAKGSKIDELVTFPIHHLRLSERVGKKDSEECVYDLFAVDEHRGEDLSTGAYSAYAKNESDGAWYHYFDSKVNPSTPEETINPGAYLLFYRRRTESVDTTIVKAKTHISRKQVSPRENQPK